MQEVYVVKRYWYGTNAILIFGSGFTISVQKLALKGKVNLKWNRDWKNMKNQIY